MAMVVCVDVNSSDLSTSQVSYVTTNKPSITMAAMAEMWPNGDPNVYVE